MSDMVSLSFRLSFILHVSYHIFQLSHAQREDSLSAAHKERIPCLRDICRKSRCSFPSGTLPESVDDAAAEDVSVLVEDSGLAGGHGADRLVKEA